MNSLYIALALLLVLLLVGRMLYSVVVVQIQKS